MKNKTTEQILKSLDRSNRIYALFLLVIGFIFLAIPKQVSNIIEYVIVGVLVVRGILYFIIGISSERKIEKISHIVSAIVSIALAAFIFFFDKYEKEIILIIVIANTAIQIIECVYRILKYRKEKQKLIVGLLNIIIYSILLVELIIEFNSPLEVIITIFGTLFLVQGIVGIISSLRITSGKNSLVEIIIKSHTLEILSGLFVVVVGASIILPFCEEGIETFGDALWYCFMLVTTIGFGDMTAVTTAGRLISVIVGLYGIVVVALITSILVNLYNDKKLFDQK